jgi:hypothetical protein
MALLRTDNSVEILRKIDTGDLGPERPAIGRTCREQSAIRARYPKIDRGSPRSETAAEEARKAPVPEVDPPLHDRTRRVLSRVLSAAVIRGLRDRFAQQADVLVQRGGDLMRSPIWLKPIR